MNILVACEESQAVTIELRKLGHEAFSCDLEPASGGHPEWHVQGDVLPLLRPGWDMLIAFPPCTDLCVSGAAHFAAKRADGRQQAAIDFFMKFVDAPIPRIAIENPIGIMSRIYRKPDQIIQPWQFGADASKATCLWLKGLPRLQATSIVPPKGFQQVVYAGGQEYVTICGYEFARPAGMTGKPVWSNQTPSGQNKLGPSPERAKLRSKTYPGIAAAMAQQWGSY